MKYEMIGAPGRQLWTKLFSTGHPSKGLVVVGTGSGEVRSVDDDNQDDQCCWLNFLGWDAVAYDKYGCGESDGEWKNVTFDILRDDLVILSEIFKSKTRHKIVLMGHSESSILAVEAAEKCQFLSALVLRVASHQEIKERIKMQLGELKSRKWLLDLEQSENSGKKFAANHPVTYWKSRMGRELTGNIIKRLPMPVLALNGTADSFTPIHAFQPIHDAIRASADLASRSIVIPDAGHSLLAPGENWINSQAAKEIEKFLCSI